MRLTFCCLFCTLLFFFPPFCLNFYQIWVILLHSPFTIRLDDQCHLDCSGLNADENCVKHELRFFILFFSCSHFQVHYQEANYQITLLLNLGFLYGMINLDLRSEPAFIVLYKPKTPCYEVHESHLSTKKIRRWKLR